MNVNRNPNYRGRPLESQARDNRFARVIASRDFYVLYDAFETNERGDTVEVAINVFRTREAFIAEYGL